MVQPFANTLSKNTQVQNFKGRIIALKGQFPNFQPPNHLSMNNPAYRIGTILYALVIGFFGANHFLNAPMMKGAVPAYLPGGIIWVYITGGALVLAAIAILINFQSKLAGYLLALMLLIFVGTIHIPAYTHAIDAASQGMAMVNLLKDTGLAAAALMIAGYGK